MKKITEKTIEHYDNQKSELKYNHNSGNIDVQQYINMLKDIRADLTKQILKHEK